MTRGGENAAAHRTAALLMLMLPFCGASANIQGPERRSAIEISAATPAITFRLVGSVIQESNAVASGAVEVEQFSLRIVARRRPVSSSHRRHINHRPLHFRLLGGIGNRLTFRIDAFCPVAAAREWLRHHVRSVGPVEDEEPSGARSLRE